MVWIHHWSGLHFDALLQSIRFRFAATYIHAKPCYFRTGSVAQLTCTDILTSLQDQIDSDEVNLFNIKRQNILDGAIRAIKRKSFKPLANISVKFSDDLGQSEGAVDAGGPTREFLRLLVHSVCGSSIFEGHEKSKILTRNETCE